MRRKSERTKDKDKSSPEKKSEKASRKSRRHSKRRKKSVSTSPEREDSGTEDNEAFKSSQDDTEEEQPSTIIVDETSGVVGAVITAEEGKTSSDVEERLGYDGNQGHPTRTRKSLKRHSVEEHTSLSEDRVPTTVPGDSFPDEEWKEDDTFWREGSPNADISEQKHKEKEGKSSVWKVKSANGSGGEIQKLKLCIVRPQEPEESSSAPRRRKRLSRTSSTQHSHKDSADAEQDEKHSRDSSEEKQKSCDSSDEKRKNRRTQRENRDSSEEKVKLLKIKLPDSPGEQQISAQTFTQERLQQQDSNEASRGGSREREEDMTSGTVEEEMAVIHARDIPIPEGAPLGLEERIVLPDEEPSLEIKSDSSEERPVTQNSSEEKEEPPLTPSFEEEKRDLGDSSESNRSQGPSEEREGGIKTGNLIIESNRRVSSDRSETTESSEETNRDKPGRISNRNDSSESKIKIHESPECSNSRGSSVEKVNFHDSPVSRREEKSDGELDDSPEIISPEVDQKTLSSKLKGGVTKSSHEDKVLEGSKSVSCKSESKTVSDKKLSDGELTKKKSKEVKLRRKSNDEKIIQKQSKRENRDSHRHRSQESHSPDHHNSSRRRGSISQSSSKHRRSYSSSKSRSPQHRREKVALRRSFSEKNESSETSAVNVKAKEDNTDTEEQVVSKEDKENSEKKSKEEKLSSQTTVAPRKRRWGASNSSRPSKKPVLAISTDSLKNLIPGAKPLPISEVQLIQDDDVKKDIEDLETELEEGERRDEREKPRERDVRAQSPERKPSVMLPDVPRISVAVTDDQRGKVVTRKISIVADDARNLQRSPSPPRHKTSSILFITNLVRPFTIQQLKELLARTGTIVEGGFWIDKIKSKCYVQYENESEARETRHALHGVRWPVSNPKQLCVDFGRREDMELARVMVDAEQIPRKAEPLQMTTERSVEGWVAEQIREQREREAREQREREVREQREKERERERERARLKDRTLEAGDHNRNHKMTAVREWDLGKIGGQLSPNERDFRFDERNRERERKIRREKMHHSRSPTPHELLARKSKKKEEDAPAKLLDDLFRKTKTTPCIYWLPLNAEQIVVKEEMRRKHMAEHERRMAEMRKAERERERARAQQRQQRRTGDRDRRRSPKK